MAEKREISKIELEEQLHLNPEITLNQLKSHFKCGSNTIARELKRHNLQTKPRHLRPLSEEHKAKLSELASLRVGDLNPNFGVKDRPWLEGENHPFRKWHKANPEFGANQRGANNPIHKVKHLYEDLEYVSKITRGIREHVKNKTGKSYSEVYGETKAEEYKQKLREASPERMAKFFRKSTKPEIEIRNILISLNTEFQEQCPIGYYTVDFYLPQYQAVIQVDGDYWHSNPMVYSEESLTERQRKQRRLDNSCNSYCANHNVSMLRIWELDLKQNPETVRVKIKEYLNVK